MRCPNSSCREIFTVQEEISQPAPDESLKRPAPDSAGVPDSILGEGINLLPAERVEDAQSPRPRKSPPAKALPPESWPGQTREPRSSPAAPQTSQEVLDWRTQAPPPRQAGRHSDGSTTFAPGLPGDRLNELEEAHGNGAADDSQSFQQSIDHHAALADAVETVEPVEIPHRRSKMPLIFTLLSVFGFVVLGVAGFLLFNLAKVNEETAAENAHKAFQAGNFKEAAEKFSKLLEDYKDSDRKDEYSFFSELSGLRQSLGSRSDDALTLIEQVNGFFGNLGSSEFFKEEYKRALGKEVIDIISAETAKAKEAPDPASKNLCDSLADALITKGLARKLLITEEQRGGMAKEFEEVHVAFGKAQRRDESLARLRELTTHPSVAAIRDARVIVRRQSLDTSGFDKRDDVGALLNQLYDGHRQQVVYVRAPGPIEKPLPAAEQESSLLIDPPLVRVEQETNSAEKVFLAVVRGVLYGLGQESGKVKWARRVGMDVTALPLRIPAGASQPERLLIPALDSSILLALDARQGTLLWNTPLTAPIQGTPTLVGPSVYVATADGLVHEINHADGQRLGHFNLTQPLNLGGTRLEESNLVFFPARDYCVYVLDVAAHTLQNVLYSEHPAGGLLGPVQAARTDKPAEGQAEPQGYLILPRADGLDAVTYQVYSLPLSGPTVQPLALQPEVRLPGRPWFRAFQDSEKIVQVTDAGIMGLYGLPQPFNSDPPLFPLVGAGVFELSGLRSVAPGLPASRGRGRAEIVYGQDRYLWVAAKDQLDCYKINLHKEAGPRLALGWPHSLGLGTPLHAAQVADTGSLLFLVTQSPGGRADLATAVDALSGKIQWQRQLGLTVKGSLQPFGDKIAVLDHGGGLCEFDPQKAGDDPAAWQTLANNWPMRADLLRLPEDSFLIAGGPNTLVSVFTTLAGTELIIRRYEAAAGKSTSVREYTVDWKDKQGVRLAGKPALRGDVLLIPLDSGGLLRVTLTTEDKAVVLEGPTWRSTQGSSSAKCFVAWLSNDDFVTTNGVTGLTRWRWPAGSNYTGIPGAAEANQPSLTFATPISSEPLLMAVPGPDNKESQTLCVAEENGKVSQFVIGAEGFEAGLIWNLGAKITAGPFVRGNFLGCVLDHNILVWIDSAKAKVKWTYATAKESIVGEPQVGGDTIAVAEQGGLIHFLGLEDGKPKGKDYRLKAISSPECGPAPFGPGRYLVPLLDGTLVTIKP